MNNLTGNSLETFVPLTLRKHGMRQLATPDAAVHDTTLLEGLGRAFYWQKLLDSGVMQSGSEIARAENLHPSVVNELLRLKLLAPDIIEQFMAGKQPRKLTLMWFQRHPLPVDWQEQRDILAHFDQEDR